MIAPLLLIVALADTPAVCLTPMQVRTANLMFDECDRDRELLAIRELEVALLETAIGQNSRLLAKAEADRTDLLRLDDMRVEQIDQLAASVKSERRKVRQRERLAWLLAGVVAIETAIIAGWAVTR